MQKITDKDRPWIPSWATDIRKTWAKYSPELVAKMTYRSVDVMPSNTIHIKPQQKLT